MNVFLDTNIILDYLCRRAEFFDDAAYVIGMCENGALDASISALTVVNCMYICRKVYEREELYDKLDWLMRTFRITPIDMDVIDMAAKGRCADFEDRVQYQSALCGNAALIITREEKGFKDIDIQVMSAATFVRKAIQV